MIRIEVHLHCVKSLTANPQWAERIHIFMRTMCKDGFLNGWLSFKDVSGNPPHFKIINLDWRSEKAIIELEEDLP